MKIVVLQEKLAKALGYVSRIAAGSRTSLPILNNVLIRADDGKVTLTTTNLDMAVVDYLTAIECENGVVTVPAKLMAEFVSNLPRGEAVEILADGGKVTITAGQYTSQMNGALAEDFPELPGIDEEKAVKFAVEAETFKTGVGQVMVAASNDMTRPALTGIFFNTNEGALYLAATDGYRLSQRLLVDKIDAEVRAVVPAASLRSALALMAGDMAEVEILLDETQIRFRLGEVELTSKLIDGSFPDYRVLIPKGSETEAEVPREELIRITKLAALFAKEAGGSVACATNAEKQCLSVAAVANELGENNSEIKTKIESDAKVILNSRFLLDALNVMSGKKITLGFSNKLDPIMVKSDADKDFTHIIMPLKR